MWLKSENFFNVLEEYTAKVKCFEAVNARSNAITEQRKLCQLLIDSYFAKTKLKIIIDISHLITHRSF